MDDKDGTATGETGMDETEKDYGDDMDTDDTERDD
jgi:hypothetical protein